MIHHQHLVESRMQDPNIAPVSRWRRRATHRSLGPTPGSVVDGHWVISAPSSARSWIRISLVRAAPARIGPNLVLGHELRWIGDFLGSGSGQRCGGEWPIPCRIAAWPVAVASVVLPAGYGVDSPPPRKEPPCPTGVIILGGVLASVPPVGPSARQGLGEAGPELRAGSLAACS